MEKALAAIIEKCELALDARDPQSSVEAILQEAVRDTDVANAIAERNKFTNLADLAIHRSGNLTLLAGALPPGFKAAPHNHNLWSVVGVCSGREDNQFYERDGDALKLVGSASVVGPGVLASDADVIHSIWNSIDVPMIVLHAYGGDLFEVPRSSWDPETHEEIPFDWQKVRTKQES